MRLEGRICHRQLCLCGARPSGTQCGHLLRLLLHRQLRLPHPVAATGEVQEEHEAAADDEVDDQDDRGPLLGWSRERDRRLVADVADRDDGGDRGHHVLQDVEPGTGLGEVVAHRPQVGEDVHDDQAKREGDRPDEEDVDGPEDRHQHEGQDRDRDLGMDGVIRRAPPWGHHAQRPGEHTGAAHAEEEASTGVEGAEAIGNPGVEQGKEQQQPTLTPEPLGHGGNRPRRRGRGAVEVVHPDAEHVAVGHEQLEDHHEDDGADQGERYVAAGMPGLLGHRADRLPAAEGEDGEDDGQEHIGCLAEVRHIQRREREASLARADDPRGCQRHHDHDLDAPGDQQRGLRDPHAAIGEEGRQGDDDNGVDPPGDVDAVVGLDARLQHDCAQVAENHRPAGGPPEQQHPTGEEAGTGVQGAGDPRVPATGRGELAGDLPGDVGLHHKGHAGEQEGHRGHDRRQGDDGGERRQLGEGRRDVRDALHEDAGQTHDVGLQLGPDRAAALRQLLAHCLSLFQPGRWTATPSLAGIDPPPPWLPQRWVTT